MKVNAMLKVGQKVVCVDAGPPRNGTDRAMPMRLMEGHVYTIRDIHVVDGIDGYGVRLEEIANPSIVWSDADECEWSYQSERFRPVVDDDEAARKFATMET
jgi:hypothetical protein